MPDEATAIETPSADPMHAAADAMATALQAARDGAADARERVDQLIPAVGGFLNRLTYTTCYAVSYGVVFPSLMVARAVPKDNAIVHGLVNGARAARDAVGSGAATASEPGTSEQPHIIVPE